MRRLLVTNKGRSALRSDHFQGHLQTS